MPIPVIGALAGVIAGSTAKTIAVEVAKFIATRALLYTLFIFILPVVLYNVFTTILEELMELATGQISGEGLSAVVINIGGMAGWIGSQLELPAAFSLIMSALGLSFVLRMLGR